MSAAYHNMVSITKEFSKGLKYNWWEEKAYQYGFWSILIVLIVTFFTNFTNTFAVSNLLSMVFLIVFVVLIILIRVRANNIITNEYELAKLIIENEDINRDYIKQLINETEASISNSRKVAQWGVGGILTIIVFLGSQILNSISTIVSALIPVIVDLVPADVKKDYVKNGNFDFLDNLVPGSFKMVLTFTLIIFGILAIVYAILQIHTLSNRRYLRLFKDIEYQLILKK
ncbi:hypothetical protein [Lactococcus lactis]|uniref:hypothetical protein n=1 Tax=Lactococcus lactis TaxID=1358 RepID=UPI0028916BE4|nr:hypothetical protein [Lactococcus lactis]MDT2867880.1 hypothetical protein [Lactococcus lactis]